MRFSVRSLPCGWWNFIGTPPSAAKLPAGLHWRESEVLQLVAEGYSSKQIAAQLSIGNKAVEKHRREIMHKLDIHSIAGLTRYALTTGMIENLTVEEKTGRQAQQSDQQTGCDRSR